MPRLLSWEREREKRRQARENRVRAFDTGDSNEYLPERKYINYHPYPGMTWNTELGVSAIDAMDATGYKNQPTHPARERRIRQREVFKVWYSHVFPTDAKQLPISDDQVKRWLIANGDSLYSLLTQFNGFVLEQKKARKPIDNPRAWLEKARVHQRSKLQDEVEKYRQVLQLEEMKSRVVYITEVSDNVPALPSPKQVSNEQVSNKVTIPKEDDEMLKRMEEIYEKVPKGYQVGSSEYMIQEREYGALPVFVTEDVSVEEEHRVKDWHTIRAYAKNMGLSLVELQAQP
jgi:hypothetical protein